MEQPKCFIMMPVSTPEHLAQQYSGGGDHFFRILEHLIIPAVRKAGFNPLLPTVEGSLVIHSEIIRRIITADMAIADMSALNPNVFFEMGIRTAINKPLAIIKDEKTTKVPFDTGIINYHTYSSSVSVWEIDEQVNNIKDHIIKTRDELDGKNGMWEAFNASRHIAVQPKNQDTVLAGIESELVKIRRQQLIPSAHTPGKIRAQAKPMEVFGKISDLASDAGYFIDVDRISNHTISVRINPNRGVPKHMQKILRRCGERYGYKVVFVTA